jgi:hydroxyacylglutathione hydrolase
MLNIKTIPCRWGIMDNYAYLITDSETGGSAVVDPSEAAPVIRTCRELDITPDYVLNTHHHFDHTDGNLELKDLYHLKIVGADERIPGLDIRVRDGETWALGQSPAKVIDVSAHTIGHILWYFPDSVISTSVSEEKSPSSGSSGEVNCGALFTGDTLFNLCIGGLFEGTPEQMFAAMEKIRALPEDTLFYPGHEYTLHGADNALACNGSAETRNYVKNAELRLKKGLPVHPVSLKLEKQANPYLKAKTFEEFLDII